MIEGNSLFEQRVEVARVPEATSFIDGQMQEGTGSPASILSPSNGAVLGEPREAGKEQVDAALNAAVEALSAWSVSSPEYRAKILEAAATRMEDDFLRLTHLVCLDTGKTYGEATREVQRAIDLLRSAAGWATRVKGTTLPSENGLFRLTWREPVGVVAAILPFNAPLLFCAKKMGAALAMGNTVIAKSPEQNPYATIAFMEYFHAAGLPAGVANVLHGRADIGKMLVSADGVDLVSFTGSTQVGTLVGQSAVGSQKRVVLELGGKSANIIYQDADLAEAKAGALAGIFRNTGQRCYSGSRLLIQDSIADLFIEDYVAAASDLKVGDPFEDDTQVGALITVGDVDRLQSIVDKAITQGAEVLCGGTRIDVVDGGAYFAPTVIDCSNAPNASLLQEEVFGPIVAIQRFADADEAISIANSSDYALAGGCWTSDLGKAMRTAREVNAGMFWINSYAADSGVEATLGGRKASGIGQEAGEEGILSYTNIKTVLIANDDFRVAGF